jgi:bifunctional non-homologous end joining protein LigD
MLAERLDTKNRDSVTLGTVTLTHPDKKLFPEIPITKIELAEYYSLVAGRMLPHIELRPLSFIACPQGRTLCFFQRHLPGAKGLQIPTVGIKDKQGVTKPYPYVDDSRDLISLVQVNVLEIHPWNSKVDSLSKADRIIFDLDPGPEVAEKEVINAALLLRAMLREFKLETFARVTGGKGIHVVAPIVPVHPWKQVKDFCRMVAEVLQNAEPKKFIVSSNKSQRVDKIFVDYLRNDWGATAIGNYSVRAREGAPVATPLNWTELEGARKIPRFTLTDIKKRIRGAKRDPWELFWKRARKLPVLKA